MFYFLFQIKKHCKKRWPDGRLPNPWKLCRVNITVPVTDFCPRSMIRANHVIKHTQYVNGQGVGLHFLLGYISCEFSLFQTDKYYLWYSPYSDVFNVVRSVPAPFGVYCHLKGWPQLWLLNVRFWPWKSTTINEVRRFLVPRMLCSQKMINYVLCKLRRFAHK